MGQRRESSQGLNDITGLIITLCLEPVNLWASSHEREWMSSYLEMVSFITQG